MARERFPHWAAGMVAVPFFLIAGAAGGYLAGLHISTAPRPLLNAAIWALVAAIGAYVAYAGQGATRPPSIAQAAVADGVVAGLGAAIVGALIDLLVGGGAGGSGTVLSLGSVVPPLVLAAIGGGLVGGLLGLPIGLMGGERLERPMAQSARRTRRATKTSRRRSRR